MNHTFQREVAANAWIAYSWGQSYFFGIAYSWGQSYFFGIDYSWGQSYFFGILCARLKARAVAANVPLARHILCNILTLKSTRTEVHNDTPSRPPSGGDGWATYGQ